MVGYQEKKGPEPYISKAEIAELKSYFKGTANAAFQPSEIQQHFIKKHLDNKLKKIVASQLLPFNNYPLVIAENGHGSYFDVSKYDDNQKSALNKTLRKIFGSDNVVPLKGGTGKNIASITIRNHKPDYVKEVIKDVEDIWNKLNIAAESVVSLKNANHSEVSDLKIGIVKSTEGEIIGLSPTVGGVETTEYAAPAVAEAKFLSDISALQHGEAVPKKPNTQVATIIPEENFIVDQKSHVETKKIAPVKVTNKKSFLSRFFSSEERLIHTPKKNNGIALALLGASAAVLIGAVISTRRSENELSEIEDSLSTNSWTKRLQAERQQSADRAFGNITNL